MDPIVEEYKTKFEMKRNGFDDITKMVQIHILGKIEEALRELNETIKRKVF